MNCLMIGIKENKMKVWAEDFEEETKLKITSKILKD